MPVKLRIKVISAQFAESFDTYKHSEYLVGPNVYWVYRVL